MTDLHMACGAFIIGPTTDGADAVLASLDKMSCSVKIPREFLLPVVDELGEFMRVGTTGVVRELSKDGQCHQSECKYNLVDVFKRFASVHVHGPDTPKEVAMGCSCPFHQESLVVHLVRAFFIAVEREFAKTPVVLCYNEDGVMTDSFRSLFQKAVTALLHDIGKPSTRVVTGYTAFPTHGDEGCRMLYILYSGASGGFNRWFSTEEWKHMCDVIQLHMEGCNMEPNADREVPLGARLSTMRHGPAVLASLCDLARVDKESAFPEDGFLSGPIMADCDASIARIASLAADGPNAFREVAQQFDLSGLIIKLDGTSCSGKTTIAGQICEFLERMGTKAVHVSRDKVIEMLGGRAVVYADDALKDQIDPTMAKLVDKALRNKTVVVYDTLQTFFGTSSLNTSGTFVMMVSPLRIGPIVSAESERHHGGDFASQLKTSGQTSPFDPSPGQRSVNMCMHGKKSVGSSSNPRGASCKGNPVIKFTVPTVTQAELHEPALGEVLQCVEHIVASGIIGRSDPTSKMNLTELVSHLSLMFFTDGMSNGQKTALLTEWFKARNYSVTTGCKRAVYLLRVALLKLHGVPNKAIRDVSAEDESHVVTTYSAMTKDAIQELLRDAEECDKGAMLVKYMDGINHEVGAPWHTECRSVVIIFTDTGFALIPVMARGIEALGNNTQDIADGDTDAFSQDLQHIFARLNYHGLTGSAEMEKKLAAATDAVSDSVVVTGKRDGSCVRVFVARVGSHQCNFLTWRMRVDGSAFEKAFAEESLVQSGGKWMMFMASNGTLSAGRMTGYFATSMIYSDLFKDDLLALVTAGSTATPFEIATRVCSDDMTMFGRFTRKIADVLPQVEEGTNATTFFFEAICPDRTDIFNGDVHTELAVSYTSEESGISFLSAVKYVDDKYVCYPHSWLKHEFPEPYHWTASVDTLLKMAGAISNVVTGSMTVDAFLETFPPSGGNGPIDAEGFVAYFTVGDKLIYTKVKTKAYYDLHKLKPCNLSWLVSMPKSAERFFPNLTTVKNFFDPATQKSFCEVLARYATSEDMMACLQGKALESYRREVVKLDANRQALMNARAENDQSTVDKMTSVVCTQEAGLVKRILGMKESGAVWNAKVNETMTRMFGPVQEDYVGRVGGFAKDFFLNEIKIQNAGYLDRLACLIDPANVERNAKNGANRGELPGCIGQLFMAVSV